MAPLFDIDKVRAAQEAHRAFRRRPNADRGAAHLSDEYLRFMRTAGEAWPEGFAERLTRLDVEGLEIALRFLEEDPFFFRSGYAKRWALRRLPRWPLDDDARRRIARIVLRAVEGPPYREFRWKAKAARLADRSVLVPGLLARLDSPSQTVAWQSFCAAHCLLDLGFPNWSQRRLSDPKPAIESMRKRLQALPEAR